MSDEDRQTHIKQEVGGQKSGQTNGPVVCKWRMFSADGELLSIDFQTNLSTKWIRFIIRTTDAMRPMAKKRGVTWKSPAILCCDRGATSIECWDIRSCLRVSEWKGGVDWSKRFSKCCPWLPFRVSTRSVSNKCEYLWNKVPSRINHVAVTPSRSVSNHFRCCKSPIFEFVEDGYLYPTIGRCQTRNETVYRGRVKFPWEDDNSEWLKINQK